MNYTKESIEDIGPSYQLTKLDVLYLHGGKMFSHEHGNIEFPYNSIMVGPDGPTSTRFVASRKDSFSLIEYTPPLQLTELHRFEKRRAFGFPYVGRDGLLVRSSENRAQGFFYNLEQQAYQWMKEVILSDGTKGALVGLGDHIFWWKNLSRLKRGDKFYLARIDPATGEEIWQQEKAFETYASPNSHTPFFYRKYLIEQQIILAFPGDFSDPKLPPACIMALDLESGQCVNKWEARDFPSPAQSDKGHFGGKGFWPRGFRWDPVSQKLLQLSSLGIYSIDPITGKADYRSLIDVLENHSLFPTAGSNLHGDHFYFSSVWDTRANRDAVFRSLGALNIRTEQIDWHYHFPVGDITVGLYSPTANDHYIATHDSEKRLHIFKKITS